MILPCLVPEPADYNSLNSNKQDLKHQCLSKCGNPVSTDVLPRSDVSPRIFPPPPGGSQLGVSVLLSNNLWVCQSLNVEPQSFRNSSALWINPSLVGLCSTESGLDACLCCLGSKQQVRGAGFISAEKSMPHTQTLQECELLLKHSCSS